MYELYVANKNYSSWSLRPWVLLRALGIPFVEHRLIFGDAVAWSDYRALVPTGKVPALIDGALTVWDSLAIVEYLAERHPGVWPTQPAARAWARSAAAEMHSGFQELRNRCSMNCGIRVKLHEFPPALTRDIARINGLWTEGLSRFGGPYLAGASFTAVDAFFAPVALRVQSYGLQLEPAPARYATTLLGLDAMQAWYAEGLSETARDPAHDEEIAALGDVLEDLRAR